LADPFAIWAASCLLLGLRLVPLFSFAPPFTLVTMPRMIRMMFGLGLSALLISAHPEARLPDLHAATLLQSAARELMLGIMFVLVMQIPFAALYMIGRTIDIQAGYGLAVVIDPATRAQMPLVGTFLALLGGSAFFALDGHLSLLKLLSASLEAIPLGQWTMPTSLAPLEQFMSVIFLMGFGLGGTVVLALFLTDLVIALLSRTVPQMNVLMLGFQVKSLVLLTVLPLSLGAGGALLMRIVMFSLDQMPRMI